MVLSVAGASVKTDGGCWQPAGLPMSSDRYTYESTNWQPQTVTLMDTRTMQPYWSKDIPVGQKLVMSFDNLEDHQEAAPADYPDKMLWDLWPLEQLTGDPARSLFVPSKQARRVDVKLRQTPEIPAPMAPGLTTSAVMPGGTSTATGSVTNTLPIVMPGGTQAPVMREVPPGGPGPATEPTPAPAGPQSMGQSQPAPTAPTADAPSPFATPTVEVEIIGGNSYLVAARLPKDEAVAAAEFLRANNVPARVLERSVGHHVVCTHRGYTTAEMNDPKFAAERKAAIARVMELGIAWKRENAKAPTNFSMASWMIMPTVEPKPSKESAK